MKSQETINEVVAAYRNKYGDGDGIKVCAVVTGDVRKLCLDLAPSEKWTEYVMKDDHLDYINGTVIPGQKITDKFHIVLSERAFSYNNNTWIGTIYHELTHAYDMYSYCKIKGMESTAEFFKDKNYSNFIMWSEFHARKAGFKIIREIVAREEEESLGKGTFQEIDEWAGWIKDSYGEEFKGFYTYRDIYQLMQHLGRLAALRERHVELHRTYFADMYKNMIFNTFGGIIPPKKLQTVYELYCLLFDCSDVTMIYERLQEMGKLIKKLLPGLAFLMPQN